ncbi:GTPase-activating protein SAC7 [Podospora aff. communis PSN243]|uniref:GTPase-activating protein SAC7 n=1 Tax=Podospora aff. communis PSN243 TaxID=3040156 RepID=A0AAV9G2A8_9PEZI|nr:GTPase-activating protein SAC7 [Podospora aff. communis PSN243]
MATPSGESMEWITINTGCFAASSAISKTMASAKRFVREVRESRLHLDDVCTLLSSLDNTLDLLKDDATALPPHLSSITPGVLEGCRVIVSELDGCIAVLGKDGYSRMEKKCRWLASWEQIGKLCGMLYGYRDILGLAVDLIALTYPGRPLPRDADTALDERDELGGVAARINVTWGHLEEDAPQNGAFTSLQWYLGALHQHALASLEAHQTLQHRGSSLEEPPDSAIELSDEQRLPPKKPLPAAPLPSTPTQSSAPAPDTSGSVPSEEIDELLDELCEMPIRTNRPPTPPPRSRARSRARSDSGPRHSGISDSNASGSDRSSTSNPSQATAQPTPEVPGHRRDWSYALSQISTISDVSYATNQTPPAEDHRSSFDEPHPGRPLNLQSVWSDSNTTLSTHRPSTSDTNSVSDTASKRPESTATRRSSFRLFKSFQFRRNSGKPDTPTTPTTDETTLPTVFGSPLSISIPLARGVAGTRHKRGGSSSTEYPLCILRCVYFLRDNGLSAPDIFDSPSDPVLLAQLKFIFSSPELNYGRDMDWGDEGFSAYEAADLILTFLRELPQPLVPESVAKRWIVLSRQATISGSLALRLDQGLDFWEEAFTGLRGPARALFKLLLGLWGEVAEASDVNDMTAERLAGRVMGPLMQGGRAYSFPSFNSAAQRLQHGRWTPNPLR